MTPTLQLGAILLTGAAALLLARYLREMSAEWTRADLRSLPAGAAAGLAAALWHGPFASFLIGVMVTLAALYLHRSGLDTYFLPALVTGTLLSLSAAATTLLFHAPATPALICAFLLAGPAAVVTVATARRIPARGLLALAVSSALAWAAWSAVSGGHLDAREAAKLLVSIAPILLIGSLFLQWPTVTRELREEARLDLFPSEEIAGVAHPVKRMGMGGWQDRDTRRKFIRKATELALKKSRQRGMRDPEARLHQLEILKLRMEVREMVGVESALLRDVAQAADSTPGETPTSDTMENERATTHR